MWLSIAHLTSPGDLQVQARHEQVFADADEDQRRQAADLAKSWVSRNVAGLR
jgi:hypothetical protein